MDQVTIAHAKEHLEELVERAAGGDVVRIEMANGGIVQLIPGPARSERQVVRQLGQWKGIVHIPPDRLLEPLTEDELDWLSGETSP